MSLNLSLSLLVERHCDVIALSGSVNDPPALFRSESVAEPVVEANVQYAQLTNVCRMATIYDKSNCEIFPSENCFSIQLYRSTFDVTSTCKRATVNPHSDVPANVTHTILHT